MRFEEVDEGVEQWAYDKNLVHFENRFKQFEKVEEEIAETKKAMQEHQIYFDALKVVLNEGDDFNNSILIELLGDKLKDKELEIKDGIGDSTVTLKILAIQHHFNHLECYGLAYNEIKNRTGKTVGGTFIKD